jgi:hypothetical protein
MSSCKQQVAAHGCCALLCASLQALALDEEVPDIAELEDDTEPDGLGISKHKATLVSDLVPLCHWVGRAS